VASNVNQLNVAALGSGYVQAPVALSIAAGGLNVNAQLLLPATAQITKTGAGALVFANTASAGIGYGAAINVNAMQNHGAGAILNVVGGTSVANSVVNLNTNPGAGLALVDSGATVNVNIDPALGGLYLKNGGVVNVNGTSAVGAFGLSLATSLQSGVGTLRNLTSLTTTTVQPAANVTWDAGAILHVAGPGALTFGVNTGATTVVDGNAVLDIASPATVSAGGTADPFTGGVNHVSVANSGVFNVTQGAKAVGTLTGPGNTDVSGTGTNLLASSIAQNTLTIGTGATVTIRPTVAGAGVGDVSQVPEPGTWVLLAAGAACLLPLLRRRQRR
jgi:hypothetical protein